MLLSTSTMGMTEQGEIGGDGICGVVDIGATFFFVTSSWKVFLMVEGCSDIVIGSRIGWRRLQSDINTGGALCSNSGQTCCRYVSAIVI